MPAPAVSSTSAATIDLRSTGSGAGAKHLEDSSAVAGQSGPSAIPTAPNTGVVPDAPSSGAPGAVAPEVKPTKLGPPYFGRLDLAIEDKVRAFDRVSVMVS